MKTFLSAGLTLLLACSACRNEEHGSPVARGRELYDLCAQCHGPDGRGNRAVRAPAIAGQHAWYVATQLHKFRDGIRGAHPRDAGGLKMRPMALSLKSDEDIAAVADYVAALPPVHPAQTLSDGRADTGAALFGPCSTCHGPDGKGDQERKAPALVRSDDWYLLSQLEHFKAHIRGGNPDDAEAALMMPWVQTLADEQAMKDVLAHVETLR